MNFLILVFLFLVVLIVAASMTKTGAGGKPKQADPDWHFDFQPHYSLLLPEKRRTYQENTKPLILKACLKAGQVKLFLTELMFLTKYAENDTTVIYVGSAPGHHTAMLVDMFPKVRFVLYDQRAFNSALQERENVDLFQEWFTDGTAGSLKRKLRKEGSGKILFISDIRTAKDNMSLEQWDEEIAINMQQQRKWCEILQPDWAMLKFRLPWTVRGKTEYFDGDLYAQPFSGAHSSETRLVTNCKKLREWDNVEYEERTFYMNCDVRLAFHDFKAPAVAGIDHCWDCWAMMEILKQHSKQSATPEFIQRMFKESRNELNEPPHGCLPDEKDTLKRLRELEPVIEKYLGKRAEINEAKKKQLVGNDRDAVILSQAIDV